MITVTKVFEFEASHYLPEYEGPCQNLHGHSYKLEVEVSGPPLEKGSYPSMVCDFKDLKTVVTQRILRVFDHNHLNKFFDLPTAENMVEWIVKELRSIFDNCLVRVRLWETSSSYAEWRRG